MVSLHSNNQVDDNIDNKPQATKTSSKPSESINTSSDILRKDLFSGQEGNENWWQDSVYANLAKQKLEFLAHIAALPSPMILPRITLESPLILPTPFEEPYNLVERRRSSIYNESDVMEVRKGREEANKEELKEVLQNTSELDEDGFERPKELKPEQKGQDLVTIKDFKFLLTPRMSSLIPEQVSPTLHSEEMKDILMPPNLTLIALGTPLLKSAPPLYSPEAMRYLQTGVFGSKSDYGGGNTNEYRKDSEVDEVANEGLQPRYFCSPGEQGSLEYNQVTEEVYEQDNFKLDGSQEFKEEAADPTENERRIGALTVRERREKIKKYLEKRKRRIWKKKVCYDCRKKVADKRLRIKGRFVTRDQAYELLGTTAQDLANNELLRTLITDKDKCSIITSAKNMRIRNLQTLFTVPEKKNKTNTTEHNKVNEFKQTEVKPSENRGLRVEILKNNSRERVVEIKIQIVNKADNEGDDKLPRILNPIFGYKRLSSNEFHPSHDKYHKQISSS